MATPTAARTPAVEALKGAKALFGLEVLVEEEPLPVLEPEAAAPVEEVDPSVGVADAEGYDAPKALTSNGKEVA